MSRRRRESLQFEDIVSFLTAVPIWVGPLLAVAVYTLLRSAWPMWFNNNPLARGIGPALAVPAAVVILIAWVVAEVVKWRNRRLLDRQENIGTIRNLSWQEFEQLVGEAYRRQGYTVEHTGSNSGDGGVDLVLRGLGRTVLVQCKQWRTRRVGVRPVRELFGVLTAERADEAILVSSGSFTPDAEAFARGKPLRLMAGPELMELIASVRRERQRTPSRIDHGPAHIPLPDPPTSSRCPICDADMVLRTARRGRNAGSQFWGCSQYPKCRGIRDHV